MVKFGVDSVLASSRTNMYAAVLRADSPKICRILTSHWLVLLLAALLLTACGSDFEPRDKVADVDTETGLAIPPYPCPDWSHSAQINWDNSNHSNYGCAVNNNIAVQVADPWDLKRGRGIDAGNTDMGVRTIQRYNAGEIPEPLVPVQTEGAGQ